MPQLIRNQTPCALLQPDKKTVHWTPVSWETQPWSSKVLSHGSPYLLHFCWLCWLLVKRPAMAWCTSNWTYSVLLVLLRIDIQRAEIIARMWPVGLGLYSRENSASRDRVKLGELDPSVGTTKPPRFPGILCLHGHVCVCLCTRVCVWVCAFDVTAVLLKSCRWTIDSMLSMWQLHLV